MKKHIYSIIVNRPAESKQPICYSYGRTGDIELHLLRDRAQITFEQSALHTADSLSDASDHICADAIEKAMLLHLLRYGRPLHIRSVQLVTDGVAADVYNAKIQKETLAYSVAHPCVFG